MNRIEIRVEFKQKTVAGLAQCTAEKILPAEYAKEKESVKSVVDYVQRILRSEVTDVVITFLYKKDYHEEATSRIWYYTPYDSNYFIVKWERWNSIDQMTEKIGARKIRELYLECVERCEKEVA